MSPAEIIREVARLTDIPAADIVSRKRTSGVMWAKVLATREIRRQFPHWSLTDISNVMDEVDHGTVIYRLTQADRLYSTNAQFRDLAETLINQPEPLTYDI